jgi:hypothetical protein
MLLSKLLLSGLLSVTASPADNKGDGAGAEHDAAHLMAAAFKETNRLGHRVIQPNIHVFLAGNSF